MKSSIASRIYRAFLITGLAYTVSILSITDFIYDDLDSTMLSAGMDLEQAFYYQQSNGTYQTWKTATMQALFVPALPHTNFNIPEIFHGLTPPFKDEIEPADGRTLLVSVKQYPEGVLYIARDTSLLEQRETAYTWYLGAVAALLLLLVFIISHQLSRRLSSPLIKLAQRIRLLEPGSHTCRLPDNSADQELNDIAISTNRFLAAMQDYIRRERSLISMASHELRTPVAVISGAVEILEKRNQLTPADKKTIERIKKTCHEMQLNVEALLLLAQNSPSKNTYRPLPIKAVIQHVITELAATQHDSTQRIHFDPAGDAGQHIADSALAHMLFRNLIDNALKHTTGGIWVSFNHDRAIVLDEGSGISFENQIRLSGNSGDLPANEQSGLGLYIVTMICEQLGWKVAVNNEFNTGSKVEIVFDS